LNTGLSFADISSAPDIQHRVGHAGIFKTA